MWPINSVKPEGWLLFVLKFQFLT